MKQGLAHLPSGFRANPPKSQGKLVETVAPQGHFAFHPSRISIGRVLLKLLRHNYFPLLRYSSCGFSEMLEKK